MAAVDVRGGGPGTRETDAISGRGLVSEIHGLVLSGGSAFGLSAASAVQQHLAIGRKGYEISFLRIPIVPQAILFDCLNGGRDSPDRVSAYLRMGGEACEAAASDDASVGSAGAGFGATTANLRGGLGQASADLGDGLFVAAMVAVNAVGQATMGSTAHFWAHPVETGSEFGGLGAPTNWSEAERAKGRLKGIGDEGPIAGTNTTIAVVATNAVLDQRGAHRLAVMAQAGLAQAIDPVHTPFDGDTVFGLSTCEGPDARDDPALQTRIGSAGADCLARAVARGVYEAASVPAGWTGPPAWRDVFGKAN